MVVPYTFSRAESISPVLTSISSNTFSNSPTELATPAFSIYFIAFWRIGTVFAIDSDIYWVLAAESTFYARAPIFTPKRRTFMASLRPLITFSAYTLADSLSPLFKYLTTSLCAFLASASDLSAYFISYLDCILSSIDTSTRSADYLFPIYESLLKYL